MAQGLESGVYAISLPAPSLCRGTSKQPPPSRPCDLGDQRGPLDKPGHGSRCSHPLPVPPEATACTLTLAPVQPHASRMPCSCFLMAASQACMPQGPEQWEAGYGAHSYFAGTPGCLQGPRSQYVPTSSSCLSPQSQMCTQMRCLSWHHFAPPLGYRLLSKLLPIRHQEQGVACVLDSV